MGADVIETGIIVFHFPYSDSSGTTTARAVTQTGPSLIIVTGGFPTVTAPNFDFPELPDLWMPPPRRVQSNRVDSPRRVKARTKLRPRIHSVRAGNTGNRAGPAFGGGGL